LRPCWKRGSSHASVSRGRAQGTGGERAAGAADGKAPQLLDQFAIAGAFSTSGCTMRSLRSSAISAWPAVEAGSPGGRRRVVARQRGAALRRATNLLTDKQYDRAFDEAKVAYTIAPCDEKITASTTRRACSSWIGTGGPCRRSTTRKPEPACPSRPRDPGVGPDANLTPSASSSPQAHPRR